MPAASRFLTISGRGVPATLPHATRRRISRRNIWADGRPPETCRPCAKTIGDGKAKIPMGMTGSAGGGLGGCLTLWPPVLIRLWGHGAEWLRSGLQNRLLRFNSGRGLHKINDLQKVLEVD